MTEHDWHAMVCRRCALRWDRRADKPICGPCESSLCIASFCDGRHHVDATGDTWTTGEGS